MRQRPQRRAAYWLVPHSSPRMLFYIAQKHSRLGFPTSTINQENDHVDIPTGQSNGDIFSVERPASQDDSSLCQVVKTN